MLKFMRQYASSWFIKIMLSMIIVTFVGFFGWSAVRGPFTRDVIATVNGEPISLGEYQNAYRRMYDLFQRVYGDSLDQAALDRLQIGRQALETLIRTRLQTQQARLAGLRVSDEELSRYIQSQPTFQRNGRFDRAFYLDILRRSRVPVSTYEAEQRQTLLLRKLEAVIRDSVKVSRPEIEEAFRWSRERVKVKYLLLPADQMEKEVRVEEGALRAFFDREKERFRIPKKIKVAYFFADIQDYERSAKVTDEEVAGAYEVRKEEVRRPERRRARHILLKLSPDAGPERVKWVRAKAEDLMNRLRKGADFAELARRESEDPSSGNGGELGAITRGELDPAFEKAVFEMKVGELRGPVRTGLGFHIIRLDGIEPPGVRPFSEVKASIADGLRAERAADGARDAIEKIWDEISQGRAFESFPEIPGVKRGVSEFFSADGKGLPLPDREKVAAAAFRLAKGETSDPIEGEGGWYVVRLVDEQPTRIADLMEVREDVEKAYVRQRSRELAEKRARQWVERLRGGTPLEEIAREGGLAVKESPFFARTEPVAAVRVGRDFYRKAFALKTGKAAQAAADQGRMVFVVTGRKAADLKELEKDGGKFREEYLKSKQALILNNWLNEVRQSVDVTIRPGMKL
ncbi:MAG: SurA N-terminal domain-containing protein [Nitrospinota bacterium]